MFANKGGAVGGMLGSGGLDNSLMHNILSTPSSNKSGEDEGGSTNGKRMSIFSPNDDKK
jgi:hypothetical protein